MDKYRIIFNAHSSSGLISGGIKWKTSSSYNHISINMMGEIYEAKFFKGVISSAKIHDDIVDKEEIMVSKDVFFAFKKYLDDSKGLSYDFKSLFGFIINKRIENPNGIFCSELSNEIFYYLIEDYVEESKKLISPHVFMTRIKFFKKGIDFRNKKV